MVTLGNDGHGWSELLPARTPRAAFTGEVIAAIAAVVGAGITGLACARRLAQLHPEKTILLVDGRAVGDAASGPQFGLRGGLQSLSGCF